jgi:hypothetical protein
MSKPLATFLSPRRFLNLSGFYALCADFNPAGDSIFNNSDAVQIG